MWDQCRKMGQVYECNEDIRREAQRKPEETYLMQRHNILVRSYHKGGKEEMTRSLLEMGEKANKKVSKEKINGRFLGELQDGILID